MPTLKIAQNNAAQATPLSTRLGIGTLAACLLALFASCFGSVDGAGTSGEPTFSKSFGSPGDDSASKAIPTADGGFLVTGVYGASFDPALDGGEGSADGTSGNLWAMKLDAYGDIQWNRTLGAQPPSSGPFLSFRFAKEGADDSVWVGYADLNRNPQSALTGNYLLDGGNVVIAKHDSNGVQEWSQTYDSGTVPGLPFADANVTARETVMDVLPLSNGNLRVVAIIQAEVLGSNGPIVMDGLWLFDLSPSGAIVWEDKRMGTGSWLTYLEGHTDLLWSRLVPVGNGLTFVISTGSETVGFAGHIHREPRTEVLTIDAQGAEVARTTHDIHVMDADAWTLSGSAGLPGGILLGHSGFPGGLDEWKAIELDALGAEVDSWDVEGTYNRMSVVANASQGVAGPEGLFFWIAKDEVLWAFDPGGSANQIRTLSAPILKLAYDPEQDLLQIVHKNGAVGITRALGITDSVSIPGVVSAWAGPESWIVDNGQILTRVDDRTEITGTVVRETDHLVGEAGIDCLQKPSGGYVISGRLPYNPENPADNTWHAWVIELDTNGVVEWQTSAPTENTTGYFSSPLAYADGKLLAGFGGDRVIEIQGVGTLADASDHIDREFHSLVPISGGGFIGAAGSTHLNELTSDKVEIVRMSADLSTTWSRELTLGTTGLLAGQVRFAPKSILPLDDGFLVAIAPIYQLGAISGLCQLDADGDLLNSWIYGLANHETVSSPIVVQNPNGGYVLASSIAARTSIDGVLGLDPANGLLMGLDEDFQPTWYTIYGGLEADYFRSLVALDDGFLIAGNSLSLGERSEAWILRTDLDGNVVQGCAAVIEHGEWPQDAVIEVITGETAPEATLFELALPPEAAVFHPPVPLLDTIVARQCSGTAAPSDPGTGGPPSGDHFTLTVIHRGGGIGTVESWPAGIDCESQCQADFPAGTTVSLTPQVAAGSFFSHWGSVDADFGEEGAEVTMNANRTVEVWIE